MLNGSVEEALLLLRWLPKSCSGNAESRSGGLPN